MPSYATFVSELEREGFAAAHETHEAVHEEGKEALTTRLMLALRTRDGIGLPELTRDYGEELGAAAADAIREAAAELPREWVEEVDEVEEDEDEDGDGKEAGEGSGKRRSSKPFRLSDPEGLLFSNEAISTVFARLDERLERSTGSAI